MKTMKNLKMSLEVLLILNPMYQYYLFIKDQQQVHKNQQPVRKDQLPLTTLRMKPVSTAMNIVHEVRTPEGQCSTQISAF